LAIYVTLYPNKNRFIAQTSFKIKSREKVFFFKERINTESSEAMNNMSFNEESVTRNNELNELEFTKMANGESITKDNELSELMREMCINEKTLTKNYNGCVSNNCDVEGKKSMIEDRIILNVGGIKVNEK